MYYDLCIAVGEMQEENFVSLRIFSGKIIFHQQHRIIQQLINSNPTDLLRMFSFVCILIIFFVQNSVAFEWIHNGCLDQPCHRWRMSFFLNLAMKNFQFTTWREYISLCITCTSQTLSVIIIPNFDSYEQNLTSVCIVYGTAMHVCVYNICAANAINYYQLQERKEVENK